MFFPHQITFAMIAPIRTGSTSTILFTAVSDWTPRIVWIFSTDKYSVSIDAVIALSSNDPEGLGFGFCFLNIYEYPVVLFRGVPRSGHATDAEGLLS